MANEKKTKEIENSETTQPEAKLPAAIILLSVASCPIVLSATEIVSPGQEFEVTEEQLASQAFRHLFVTGGVQFKDDAARTAEYQEKARQGIKKAPQPLTVAEAEKQENKEY